MSKYPETYSYASDHIGAYVQAIRQGDWALPFDTRDETGRPIKLAEDYLSGKHLILVFLNEPPGQTNRSILEAVAARAVRLRELNTEILAISADSHASRLQDLKAQTGFRWPILTDATGAIFASYGLHKFNGVGQRIVLLTPNRQIRTWFDGTNAVDANLGEIMKMLENAKLLEESRWAAPHAPVLVVPNVLSPEECRQLISNFDKNEPFMVRPPRPGEITGNYKIPVYEHNRQDRVDQILKDPNTLSFLDERIFSRVAPMIKKAFAYDVTRREDLHIARYAGERGGHEMGHRDNTSASTAYRRFAFSMNLNDDYDGGEVVFNEYSTRGYKPAPGTALIFSSALLHEVTETTNGIRYTLISHFFNEQSMQHR